MTNRLWHRVITRENPLEVVDLGSTPLQRIGSRMYARMSVTTHTFYTKRQLEKLHRQLAHPSATKLYDLLKTAGTQAETPETLKTLQRITAACEVCQKIGNAPSKFRISMGSEYTRFN